MTKFKMIRNLVLVATILLFSFPVCCLAASVSLNWTANSESDIAHYSVYYGTASRTYGNPVPVGKATNYTVANLSENETYYFALTATDTSGNESGFSSEASATATDSSETPPPTSETGTNIIDFNSDGKPDIFWHQNKSGGNVVWHMNGTKRIGHSWLPKVGNPLWKAAAVGDLNRDGYADIMFRHDKTGQNVVWHMKDQQKIGHSWLPTVSITHWKVEGLSDFDKNGSLDILWRQTKTGENVIWLMDATQRIGSHKLKTVSSTLWEVGGLGDFNQDGNVDIFWHHAKTGQNIVWHMDGVNKLGYSELAKRTGKDFRDWQVAGVGDLDQDGSVDILWRNYHLGENDIWMMDKTARKSMVSLPKVADSNWESKL